MVEVTQMLSLVVRVSMFTCKVRGFLALRLRYHENQNLTAAWDGDGIGRKGEIRIKSYRLIQPTQKFHTM